MFESRLFHAKIEPLEARIAPALAVLNPLADMTVGPGRTGADIDLSRIFDPIITDNGHTIVTLQTNFDSDPNTAGIQGEIVIEMLDDQAPLTVQAFLGYLTNTDPKVNYENTFFHRSVPGFVVQGGGFDVSSPGTHIPTQFDVHNEFDGVNRSNLAGTIAMAKTGLGPNTGSSEWFFNLANNSSNLDAQNGGFTVFARVIQGMNVVNAIAALTTVDFSGASGSIGNINGAFNDLPLQNYNSNPDNNPNTPAPSPTADNYVRLTGYSIQAPPSGTVTGITYSLIPAFDIVDATTGLPSDLVTASITGSTLHLDYKAHAAGAVRVTVRAIDASSNSGEDSFVVNLQPNLVAIFDQDPFDGVIIGGDTKTANIVIGNNGGGWAVGNVNVKVYLSKIEGSNGTDTNGALVEPDRDILLGDYPNQPVDLAGGGTLTLAKTLQIPRQLVTTAGEAYRVLVEVKPADSAIAERFSDDNVSLDSGVHVWENRFGTFTAGGTTRTDTTLVYQEADGDVVQFSMTKSGNGLLTFDGTLVDVAVVSPRPASVLTAAVVSSANVDGGDIDLHNVELQQYIRTVRMSEANITGTLSAAEGFLELTAGDLTGPSVISIGRLPTTVTVRPTMTLGDVSDTSVESLAPLRLIRAAEWIETDGTPNRIDAPSIGNIAINGNLEASIATTTTSRFGVFYVGGFFKDSTLTTRANVGTINVGGLDHANIFVGTTARPDDAGDFAQARVIANLTVRGVVGEARSFIASNVAAATIGSIFVKDIDSINSPSKFGIVADAIRSYDRAGGPSSGALSDPQRFDGRGRYSLTIV
jgi:cyclophilin family peptidyl-prolyl cis-trans isomerase